MLRDSIIVTETEHTWWGQGVKEAQPMEEEAQTDPTHTYPPSELRRDAFSLGEPPVSQRNETERWLAGAKPLPANVI